jgi:hypothetical protein
MRQWASYYRRLLKKAFRSAWFYTALTSGIFAIVIRYLQDKHPTSLLTMNHLAWRIPLWLFVLLVLINLVVGPYQLHKEDTAVADAKEAESQSRIAELVSRPELEILFDNADPDFVYTYLFGPSAPGAMVRLWKVAVRGKGGRTVEDVNLELVAMDPRPFNSPLPLPLHPVHGAINGSHSQPGANVPGLQYGGLNPGTPRFFDVIQMLENDQAWMEIYTTAPVTFRFSRGRYLLKLRANGRDAIAAERSFIAEVNAEGRLEFRPQET